MPIGSSNISGGGFGTGLGTDIDNTEVASGYALVSSVAQVNLTADINTTSTSYADMTGVTKTFTPTGTGTQKCLIVFSIDVGISVSGGAICLGIHDGTAVVKEFFNYFRNNGDIRTISGCWLVDLTGGSSQTVKLQWKVGTGGGTANAYDDVTADGTSSTVGKPHIDVIQVSA